MRISINIHPDSRKYMFIHTYVCICVCVFKYHTLLAIFSLAPKKFKKKIKKNKNKREEENKTAENRIPLKSQQPLNKNHLLQHNFLAEIVWFI